MAIAAIAAALTLNGFPGGAFTIRIAAALTAGALLQPRLFSKSFA
jgi:hypothetical protein